MNRVPHKSPARYLLIAGALVILTAVGFAILKRDAATQRFADLHNGAHIDPAGPDTIHHHAGHIHAGMTRDIGSAAIGESRLTVNVVGDIEAGSVATYHVLIEGRENLHTVAVWIGGLEDEPLRPYHTPDLAVNSITNDTHFHLPALARELANQRVWLEVCPHPGADSQLFSFPLTG